MAKQNVCAKCMMSAWRPLVGNAVFVRAAMIPGTAIALLADNLEGSVGNSHKKSRLCLVSDCLAGGRFLMICRLDMLDLV